LWLCLEIEIILSFLSTVGSLAIELRTKMTRQIYARD
jgi:hypothetical protein